MIIGVKTLSIQAFDLRKNGRFLLRHDGCVIVTLTTCIGNIKICKSAFHKWIYEGCLGFSWWQKTRIATRRACNSHKENCEYFLISNWILRKVEENFPFSAQTCDHFIATSWIYDPYHLWNFFKTPLQIHYRYMKVNNLSKSPSLALFFIWNCVGGFF